MKINDNCTGGGYLIKLRLLSKGSQLSEYKQLYCRTINRIQEKIFKKNTLQAATYIGNIRIIVLCFTLHYILSDA